MCLAGSGQQTDVLQTETDKRRSWPDSEVYERAPQENRAFFHNQLELQLHSGPNAQTHTKNPCLINPPRQRGREARPSERVYQKNTHETKYKHNSPCSMLSWPRPRWADPHIWTVSDTIKFSHKMSTGYWVIELKVEVWDQPGQSNSQCWWCYPHSNLTQFADKASPLLQSNET